MKGFYALFMTLALSLMSFVGISAQNIYFTENFNNTSGNAIPTGWNNTDNVAVTTDASYLWMTDANGYSATRCAYLSTNANFVTKCRLKTPAINIPVTGEPRLSFRLKTGSDGGSFNVYISTNGGVSYDTAIVTGLSPADWNQYEYLLTAYKGKSIVLVFEGLSTTMLNKSYVYYLDDVLIDKAPSCNPVTGLTVVSATSTTAAISWSTDTRYGLTPAQFSVSLFDLAGNPISYDPAASIDMYYTFNNLDPNTIYKAWVRSNCVAGGGGYSDSVSVLFATHGLAINPPYNENFDTAIVLPEGTMSYSAVINMDAAYAYGNTGRSLKMIISGSENAYIYFPLLNLDANNFEMDFKIRREISGTQSVQYRAGYIADITDPSSFFSICSGMLTDNIWHSIRFNSSTVADTSHTVMPAIFIPSGTNNCAMYIDDISIHAIPPCIRPENVTISDITTNSMVIDWNTSTAQNVVIAATNTETSQVTTVTATQHPYTLTGLASQTTYSITLQANCGSDGYSDITAPVTARTLCGIAHSATLTEGFEELSANQLPECWEMGWFTNPEENTKPAPFSIASDNKHSGTKALTLVNQPDGTVSYMRTPALPIDVAGKYDVSLWAYRSTYNSPDEYIEIWATTSPNSTAGGTLLGTIHSYYNASPIEPLSGYYQYQYNIPLSGNVYIMIVGYSDEGATLNFDDFEVILAPACRKVSHIEVKNITASSCEFEWIAGGSETQWQVDYQLLNGTAAIDTISTVVSSARCTIPNLEDGTRYTATGFIRSICNNTDTSVAVPFSFSFNTTCLPLNTLPYITGFEVSDNNGESNPMPLCWSRINTFIGTESVYPYNVNSSTSSHSGNYSLCFKTTDGNTGYEFAVLPAVNTTTYPMNTLRLKLYCGKASHLGANGSLVVGVMSNPTDISTFVPVDTLTISTTSMDLYKVSLASYSGAGSYVAIKMGLSGSAADVTVYVDDVTLEEIPTCADIDMLPTVSSLSNSSATITQRDQQAVTTGWSYAYGVHGGNVLAFATADATGANITINGLSAVTSYDVYVRRKCSEGVYGAWSEPITFTTTAVPATIPYNCSFEDATDNNNWQFVNGNGINTFAIGNVSTAAYAGFNGLYISNNNGITHEYTLTSATSTYAYRTIHFDEQGYQIDLKFRLTGGESSTNDFSRVMLVPANEDIKGGAGAASTSFIYPNNAIFLDPDGQNTIWKTTGNSWIETDANGWASLSVPVDMQGRSGNYNLAILWCNNASVGTASNPIAIDDISISTISCLPPSDIIVLKTFEDSALINIPNGTAAGYEIIVSNANFTRATLPTAPVYRGISNSDSIPVSNLQPNTDYYYAVRTICNNSDTSTWSSTRSFQTYCSAYDLPYTEGFENVSENICWRNININSETSSVTYATGYHKNGIASMKVEDATLVSPELNVDTLGNCYLKFWVYSTVANKQLTIGVMNDPNDIETFESLDDITIATSNQWCEVMFLLDALKTQSYSAVANARYIVIFTGQDLIYIDDIEIDRVADCEAPYNIATSNVTSNSFDISFSTITPTTQWLVKVNKEYRVINSNPATVSGLEPATDYAVSIASLCNGTDTSRFSDGGKIHTECASYDLPWICGFEQEDGYQGVTAYTAGALETKCWNTINVQYGGKVYPQYYVMSKFDNRQVGSQYLYTYNTYSTSIINSLKDTMYMILPEFNAPSNNVCIKFWYKCGTSSKTATQYPQPIVGYMTDINDESTFHMLKAFDRKNTYTLGVLKTSDYTNIPANARLVIGTAREAGKSGGGAMYLDEIVVSEIMSCSDPETPTVSNTTNQSADVSFTDTCNAHNAWQYVVGEAGFKPATATPVDITTTSFTLSGLDAETIYDVWVRAVCGTNDYSNWVRVRFTTACSPFHVTPENPYYDSFENYTTSEPLGGCYQYEGFTSSTNCIRGQLTTITASAETYQARTGMVMMTSASSVSAAPRGQSMYRLFHLEAGHMYKPTLYIRTAAADGVEANIMIGKYPTIDSMTIIKTISLNKCESTVTGTKPKVTDFRQCFQPFSAYITVPETGDYYIGYNFQKGITTLTTVTVYTDDLTMEELTGCLPTTASLLSATKTTATFSIADTVLTHNFEYQVFQGDEVVVDTTAAIGNPFIVTGLSHSSQYTLRIRQTCGDGEYSEWSEVSFSTLCGAISEFPYSEGFEGATFPPACWTNLSYGSPDNAWKINSTATRVHSGTKAASLADMQAGAKAALITNEFILASPYGYKVKFWMYRASDHAGLTDDALHVAYSTVPVTTSTINNVQEIGVVNRHYQQSPVESAAGKYEYEFEIPAGVTGSCYVVFDFHNQYKDEISRKYEGAAFIDDIYIEPLPSCAAPKNAPTLIASTMTTLTLNTNATGKAGVEYEWALSSAPETAIGRVVSTTGTGVVTGLSGSTSYSVRYRYICAVGDTSEWSPMRTSVTTATDCFAPQNLRTVGIVNDHHASVTWGPSPLATGYEYVLRQAGVTLDSATTALDTLTFDTLAALTSYTVSVRTICSEGATEWQTLNISTTYITFDVPYTCNFENDTINNGWQFASPVTSSNALVIGTDNTGVYTGSRSLYVSNNGSTFGYTTGITGSTAEVLLELEAGNYYVEYDWLCLGQVSKDYGRVFLMPSTMSLTSITSAAYSSTLPAGLISADNESQLGQQATWAHNLCIANVTNAGLYKLVVLFVTDANTVNVPGLAIDNINVEKVSCMPVSDVSMLDLSQNSASFKVRRQRNSIPVEYGYTTFNSVDSVSNWISIEGNHPFDTINLSGLTPATEYHCYVRHICTETESSTAVESVFRTTKRALTTPYISSFESGDTTLQSWTMTAGVSSNYFTIGNGISYEGNSALYVTNDGSTHGYNFTGKSISYAYAPIYLEEGTYGVSYEWISNGETSDYGRFFLAPTTYTPTDNIALAGLSQASVPTGCIALDNGTLFYNSAWSLYDNDIIINRTGTYYLVAYWQNGTANGNLPPLAIDKLDITQLSCPRPTGEHFTIDSAANDMIRMKITGYDSTASFIYHLASNSYFLDTVAAGQSAVGDSLITIGGLDVSTLYYLHLTAVCAEGDTSAVATLNVRTACGVRTTYPYYEGFEAFPAGSTSERTSYIIGGISGQIGSIVEGESKDALIENCWYRGTTSTNIHYTITDAYNSAYSGSNALYVDNLYAAQPLTVFGLPLMDNLNGKRFTAMYRNETTVSGGAVLQVGYLTSHNDYTSFVVSAVAPVSAVYTEFSHIYSNVPNNARPAIRVYGTNTMLIDDIRINTVVDGNEYNDTVCYGNGYIGHGFEIATGTLMPGDTTISRTFASTVPGTSDSTIRIHLHVLNEISTIYYDTICNGEPYVKGRWNIQNPQSFSYSDTYTGASIHGCDSSVVLVLTVIPTTETRYDTICQGSSYSFYGQTLTTSGTYTGYTTTTHNCPDTVTLYLTVVDTFSTISVTICEGNSYTFEGKSYTQTGVYRVRKTGLHDCPLTKELNLTVVPHDSIINVSFCQGGSIMVVDTLIQTPGTYTLNRTGYYGCDLVYHITATTTPAPTGVINDVACEGYPYSAHGIKSLIVTKDTVIYVTSRTIDNKCDSVTEVNIRYQPTHHTDTTANLKPGESITWHDQTYSKAGDYPITLHDVDGCDSIVTLHVVITGTAVENVSDIKIDVVPNPVNAGATTFVYGDFGDVTSVEILNNFGQVIDQFVPAGYPIEVQGITASGIYYVRLTSADGKVHLQKFIVK